MNKYAQMADRLYDQEQQMKRLEEENKELKEVHESDKRSLCLIAKKGAELEKKISILLSCKNCTNNKGGYICQKEYEGKCLSQKIQYIKELQEEIAELELKIKKLTQHLEPQAMTALFEQVEEEVKQEQKIKELEKENAELKEQIGDVIECFTSSSSGDDFEMAESAREVMEVLNMQCYRHGKVKSKLTKAKEIIRDLLFHLGNTFIVSYTSKEESITKAEKFLGVH